jgi:endonuclease-3
MARPVRVKPASGKKRATAGKRATTKQADPARIAAIVDGLEQLYPDAHCELDFQSPFQLLIATILSAQTTDVRVNMVTPVLFKKYGTPAKLAAADPRDVEEIIKSTGFFRNKAKNILGAARVIMEDFDGAVPQTMEELLTLPGVARKTANVVLGSAYAMNEGFVVDTHVMRLSQRLGLTKNTEPSKIEPDLMERLPRDKWTKLGHQLIWHGRRVCFARKPACGECALAPHCPSAFKV